jgi:hypothetical protein
VKYLIGEARVLKEAPAVVKVDGGEMENARCFLQETYSDGRQTDVLVLWLPDESEHYEREIIMIDRENTDVGQPNSSNRDYGLLLGRFLLQSESAQGYVSFRSMKWGNKDPKLEIKNDLITFVYPGYSPGRQEEKQRKIEIIIIQKD